jgi:hypothetical protein
VKPFGPIGMKLKQTTRLSVSDIDQITRPLVALPSPKSNKG